MSANTLPAGLRRRELLAVRRDALAADIMAMLLIRPKPEDVAALQRFRAHLIGRYKALGNEIAALGEVCMGPGVT